MAFWGNICDVFNQRSNEIADVLFRHLLQRLQEEQFEKIKAVDVDEKNMPSITNENEVTTVRHSGKRARSTDDEHVPETNDEIHPEKKICFLDWMKRNGDIEDQPEHCSELPTKKRKHCKPFKTDSSRSSMISDCHELQMTEGSQLKYLVAEYIHKNSMGRSGRVELVKILNLLPNRIEAPYSFFTYYLPKARAEYQKNNINNFKDVNNSNNKDNNRSNSPTRKETQYSIYGAFF